MKPSEELDIVVAESVMGVTVQKYEDRFGIPLDVPDAQGRGFMPVPQFSRDANEANVILEKIKSLNIFDEIIITINERGVSCGLYDYGDEDRITGPMRSVAVVGETIAHAISLAAVKAME